MLTLMLSLLAAPPTAPDLRAELLARRDADQTARKATARPGSGPDALAAVRTVDAGNRRWLGWVVGVRGWPGKSVVGADGASAAWLLVQHMDADRPFQRRCLPLMEQAVKAGEADGKDLAYLTDRVLVGEGKSQRYGTQLRRVDGKLQPKPLEDPVGVDARRAAVGLDPLQDYLEFSEKVMREWSAPASKK